ncbi:MAG: hypothetical protein FJY97_07685 [candidate division Zixibacteria bacterium]|nr:hypothetical protein [candidate division Zixibacteria bacterium]
MYRYLAIIAIALTTQSLVAEPISIGVALADGVLVYADTTDGASVVDTLEFGEDRLAFGIREDDRAVFDRNGWVLIERPTVRPDGYGMTCVPLLAISWSIRAWGIPFSHSHR